MSILPAQAAQQSLGDTIKKIFSTPTPTPAPRKKKKTSSSKTSPTPTASASPKKKPSPSPSPKEEKSPTPSVTPSPKKKKTPAPEDESESPTPSPRKKKTPSTEEESESPSPSPKRKKSSPTPSPETNASAHRKKKTSPTPEPFETPTPTETPSPTATPEESASASASPKKHGAPNATLTPDQIKGFEGYPASVQRLLTSALELTTQNLDYKYGSADPSSGGLDCSGFVYFVLRQNGITDVPRDSSGQYVWLRRARTFEPVISEKDDSFELENLKPGDLLFWTGTYAIERDPPITHAMIYLGREKKSGQRVMVGSSDGRVYQGESRNGVSVFDFKVQHRGRSEDGKLHPTFVGYAHLPGLQE